MLYWSKFDTLSGFFLLAVLAIWLERLPCSDPALERPCFGVEEFFWKHSRL